jgi:diguanylate cyclase (GGDEF)-like protein
MADKDSVTRYTWLCPTELDRERLINTVGWVRPARALMFVVLTLVLIGTAPQLGWWPLIPLAVAAVGSTLLYRNLDRRQRPEYWATAGWLLTQLMLGVGIALSGGPHSPALSWLAIAIVSLVARFSRDAIIAGLGFLAAMLVVLTVGISPSSVWHHPSELLVPAGLMFSVLIFAVALMRSDLDHRSHDKLTGLPNQSMFVEHLRLAISRLEERGGAVAVVALDLDHFRLANETLGPSAGDELLRRAAARLARATESAELLARRSADEFLVLLADSSGEQLGLGGPWESVTARAQKLAHAAQAALAEPFDVLNEDVFLGVSAGISVHEGAAAGSDLDGPIEKLLSQAQHALSAAESAGPGSVVVYDEAKPESRTRLSLITRLRKAIDREEFVLHYQPTVDLDSGETVGVEALVRWEDPKGGLVMPGEFIDVAEETGLIESLGSWVFADVCRQASEWHDEGLDLDIAFNLSPRQLWQPNLLEEMFETLAAGGVPPGMLVAEITESSMLRDPDRVAGIFAEMTSHGLRLAIDDFGVGLSSLSRLRDMPADVLKIDRSFISDITNSTPGAVMVRTIIQLAQNLAMPPHAEGIETEAQRKFLIRNGCHQGQGFLFSRARPAEEIPQFARRAQTPTVAGNGRAVLLDPPGTSAADKPSSLPTAQKPARRSA